MAKSHSRLSFDKPDWVLNNSIHPTAEIQHGVTLGKHNVIGANVIIGGFKGDLCDIVIGDYNVINDGTRILVERFRLGDDNTIHNGVTILAGEIAIGSKCWIGQRSVLDGTGGLTIEDQIAIGYNSYIWTHAGWKYLPEKCLLAHKSPVLIKYGTWMMGCNIVVNPGVIVEEKTVIFSNSVITKSTKRETVYAGNPAIELDVKAWG